FEYVIDGKFTKERYILPKSVSLLPAENTLTPAQVEYGTEKQFYEDSSVYNLMTLFKINENDLALVPYPNSFYLRSNENGWEQGRSGSAKSVQEQLDSLKQLKNCDVSEELQKAVGRLNALKQEIDDCTGSATTHLLRSEQRFIQLTEPGSITGYTYDAGVRYILSPNGGRWIVSEVYALETMGDARSVLTELGSGASGSMQTAKDLEKRLQGKNAAEGMKILSAFKEEPKAVFERYQPGSTEGILFDELIKREKQNTGKKIENPGPCGYIVNVAGENQLAAGTTIECKPILETVQSNSIFPILRPYEDSMINNNSKEYFIETNYVRSSEKGEWVISELRTNQRVSTGSFSALDPEIRVNVNAELNAVKQALQGKNAEEGKTFLMGKYNVKDVQNKRDVNLEEMKEIEKQLKAGEIPEKMARDTLCVLKNKDKSVKQQKVYGRICALPDRNNLNSRLQTPIIIDNTISAIELFQYPDNQICLHLVNQAELSNLKAEERKQNPAPQVTQVN
ncbi:hypothetical protein HZB00_01080, partial [Candidatus Woesearchaeota archaeon]|nr:hypothetical protein [Candidatus Woesearchaeota archaeon]